MATKRLIHADYRVYMVLIVVLATFLRLLHLNYQSLWYDELHSVIPTAPGESVASVIKYGEYDQPPGFFLLLHYWFKLFAYNEFFARLLAAVIGVAGVIAMYFLGKEFKNRTVGLVASFITAINWFHLYFSQEVRFYGLLFLLTALSYWFFIKAYKTTQWPYFGLYALTGIGLLYTHYYGMFVLFVQFLTFLYLITTRDEKTRFISYGLGAGLLILLGFSPWIPVVLHDYAQRGHWMTLPNLTFPAVYYFVHLGSDPFLAVLFMVLGFLVIGYAWKQKKDPASGYSPRVYLVVLVLWGILSYVIPYVYSVVRKPILHERYAIIVLPALFVLVSWGIALIPRVWIRTAILAAIIVSTSVNFLFVKRYYTRITKNQFREVSQEVIRRNTNGASIYSDQAWHYGFYFRQYGAPYPLHEAVGVNFQEALAREQQVWVLRGLVLNGVDEVQQKYLDEHYELKDQVIRHGASAYLYQRKQPDELTQQRR